jgi:hypothetical protein
MYKREIVLSEIDNLIESKTIGLNYKKVLNILRQYYLMFTKDIDIEDYSITDKHHYLSIKKKELKTFSFIEVTDKFIEFRFPQKTQFFVIDESFFKNCSVIFDYFLNEFIKKKH